MPPATTVAPTVRRRRRRCRRRSLVLHAATMDALADQSRAVTSCKFLVN